MALEVAVLGTNSHFQPKVGSFAISTIDYDLWSNTPVAQAPQRNRKVKVAKQILHPIFATCANVTTDPFWAERFTAASVGTFPKGFSFNDDVLLYRKGARSHTLEVSKNGHEAAPACMEFFRAYGGIFSPLDQANSIELQFAQAQAAANQDELTWATANKKVQECMINNYLSTMMQVMSLTVKETGQLRQTVKLGISHKYFGKDNIVVAQNRIQSVQGLLWNPTLREFYINPELKPNMTRSYARKKDGPAAVEGTQKDTVPQFTIKWDKYLKNLEKKEVSYVRRLRRTVVRHQGSGIPHLSLVITPTNDTATTPHTDTSASLDDDDEE
jgi:hypothetical protein